MDRPELTGGVRGAALGEALGLPWAGVAARRISRRKLLDDVGPTGAFTAALLSGEGDPLAVALRDGWSGRHDTTARLGIEAFVVARLAAQALAGRPIYQLLTDHGDDWPVPFHGTDANDRAVVDALLAILARHDDPTEGMTAAVRLGGAGTARLGALTGAILGCRRPAAVERVPWRERVTLPSDSDMKVL
jgi:ADP-ribosylglycohydrolase